MSRRILRAPLALLTAAAALAAAPSARADEPAGGGVIVQFDDSVSRNHGARIVESAGGDVGRPLEIGGPEAALAEPAAGETVAQFAARLERRPGIEFAEPDVPVHAAAVPNDPFVNLLWGVRNLGGVVLGLLGISDADADVSDAWDLTTGDPGTTVAVADGGVALAHPDLAPNIWKNPGETGGGRETNGRDDDGNGYVDDWRGWDFVGNDNDPADEDGHGSHVAGVAAAAGNNGTGIAGVTWRSPIMALRFLDRSGVGMTSDAAEAIAYAARKGARIVNLSFLTDQRTQALSSAIAAVPNTLIVAAAGNQSRSLDSAPGYPCSDPAPNVICVGASDASDKLASFSNYGSDVDLTAPGTAIYSTDRTGYSYFKGTSMAAPQVDGAAALAWSWAPGASVAQVRSALIGSVDRKPAFSGKVASEGRLNVRSALEQLRAAPASAAAPAPQSPVAAQSSEGAAQRVRLSVPSTQSARTVARRGFAASCTVSAGGSCRVVIRISSGVARRLRIARRSIVIGRRTVRPRGSGATFRVRVTRRAGRALVRSRSASAVTVEATATGSAPLARLVRVR